MSAANVTTGGTCNMCGAKALPGTKMNTDDWGPEVCAKHAAEELWQWRSGTRHHCYADRLRRQNRPKPKEWREKYLAVLSVAGIKVLADWELPNDYWPDALEYDDVRTPWWLMLTRYGLLRIGRRKSVDSFDWEATKYRFKVTEDDVTKTETMVHAWSDSKLTEYVTRFRGLADAVDAGEKAGGAP